MATIQVYKLSDLKNGCERWNNLKSMRMVHLEVQSLVECHNLFHSHWTLFSGVFPVSLENV